MFFFSAKGRILGFLYCFFVFLGYKRVQKYCDEDFLPQKAQKNYGALTSSKVQLA